MKMIRAFTSVLLLLTFNSLLILGQDITYSRKELNSLDLSIGGSCLSDEYILVQKQRLGVSASFKVRFESKNRKFAIAPMIGLRNYQVAVNNEDFDNVLLALRVGLSFDFCLYRNPNKDFSLSNFVELCYSNYRNFLRQEVGTSTIYTGTGPQQKKEYDTQTLYRGEAPSLVLGYKLKYKMFIMDFGYDIVKSYIHYEESIFNSLKAANPDMEEHPGAIFSAFNLHVGVSIPFSQIGRHWFYY